MKRLSNIWIVAFVLACGSNARSPSSVRIHLGDESELTDCTYLQKVEGTASDSDDRAEVHAKQSARAQAAAIGATDIRWIVPCCTYVEADAYRCDVPELAQNDD